MLARFLNRLAWVLVFASSAVLVYCMWVYGDQYSWQTIQSWMFDRQVAEQEAVKADQPLALPDGSERQAAPVARRPFVQTGETLGRLQIPRLGLSVMVVEGDGDEALRRGAGHIDGTAMPGSEGNVGIAGHRDTLFRKLKGIEDNDLIEVRTLRGEFKYRVTSLRIVEPSEVEVLNASAGETLTLVTCYPFDYVGAAPRRFIVRAERVGS